MNRDQFAAYYEVAVDRIVTRLTASGVRTPDARVAVQEAMIRTASAYGQLTDDSAADAHVERIAHSLAGGWAAKHTNAFGDLGGMDHDAPTAALDFADVERRARHRDARRTGMLVSGIAAVAALALLAFVTVELRTGHAPRNPPTPVATSAVGGRCPADEAWRTALSPNGAAWDLHQPIAGPKGALASKRGDGDLYTLWWLPDFRVDKAELLDTAAGVGYGDSLVPPFNERYMQVGDGFAAWITPQQVKVWDGSTVRVIGASGGSDLRIVGRSIQWVERSRIDAFSTRTVIVRYDLGTGNATTLASLDLPANSPISTAANFYAIRKPESSAVEIHGYGGQLIGSIASPLVPRWLDSPSADAYFLASELHVISGRVDQTAWKATVTDGSGTHLARADQPTLDGDFYLFVSIDGFHVVDLSTRREAVVPRYVQESRWQSTARLSGGWLTYSGFDEHAESVRASEGTAVADGGPRFTRLSELPHITC